MKEKYKVCINMYVKKHVLMLICSVMVVDLVVKNVCVNAFLDFELFNFNDYRSHF